MLKYNKVIQCVNKDIFKIPLIQDQGIDYYPDYVAKKLNDYLAAVKEITKLFNSKLEKDTNDALVKISMGFQDTMNLYYEGKIVESNSKFQEILNFMEINKLKIHTEIDSNQVFYRARKSKDYIHFNKNELFHIKFDERYFVSTNRYSIPGFPVLYLGDSTYVCWEEFERHDMQKLWFALFQPTSKLNIIKLHRFEDFLKEVDMISQDKDKLDSLLRYIFMFPLILACSIKVKHKNAVFKPEYIIPQMLLQYVSNSNENIDGIKYPSSKVDYGRIFGVNAYNYVFPVKSISSVGYCKTLMSKFKMTEPTSLDIEQILYNPQNQISWIGESIETSGNTIEILKGQKNLYDWTSFGIIEKILTARSITASILD